jgi:hypothetical protein
VGVADAPAVPEIDTVTEGVGVLVDVEVIDGVNVTSGVAVGDDVLVT